MEKFKKRLIIFMPSIDGGGVEKNLFIISNYLSKKIDKIILITFDNRFNRNFDKKIKILNVVNNPKENYSKYYKYYKCLLLLTSEVLKEKSLIFAFQANIYCCLLSLILRFDLITRSNSSPTGWSKNLIKNLVFKFLFKIPKKIIVNSKDFKKEIDKKFKINTKLIYNPLNLTEIKKLSKNKFSLSFFNNVKIRAINVARFTDQKDHLTLLKSILILVKKNFKIKLLIIGYGPNKSKMLSFIKKNKLKRNVKIINFQKNPYKFIMKSNLFILSSLYEGLPNVLLESMTLKKSVISSNCPTGPKEILKNGKLGILFPPQNEKILAKKIVAFKNDQKKFSIIADHAFKSLKRFDYDYNCEKYFQLIRKHIS